MKKRILVTNDDGIHSEGIQKLASALKRLGEVFVVAPDREQSAASHSLTLHRPLRVTPAGKGVWAVDGTPTDCVTLAVNGLLSIKPDIVVSGINRGGNMGEDVTYSGTVSAAMEGTLNGIPSVAVSQLAGRDGTFDFATSAAFSRRVAKRVLEEGVPRDTLLNVNVPPTGIKGYRVTTLGKRFFSDVVIEKTDPRGRKYYWIGGEMTRWEGGPDADFRAIKAGYVSITPLHLDLTNHSSIVDLKGWRL